jgi:hypothetical protein
MRHVGLLLLLCTARKTASVPPDIANALVNGDIGHLANSFQTPICPDESSDTDDAQFCSAEDVSRDDVVAAQAQIDCFSGPLAPHEDANRITFGDVASVIRPALPWLADGAKGLVQIYCSDGNGVYIDQYLFNTIKQTGMEYKEIACFYAVRLLCIHIGASTSADQVNWMRFCGNSHATEISNVAYFAAVLPPASTIVKDAAALGYVSCFQFKWWDFPPRIKDCWFSLLSKREITVRGNGYDRQVSTVLTCETIAMSGFAFVAARVTRLSSPAENAIAAAMTWIRLVASEACSDLARTAIAHLEEPWIQDGRPRVYAPPAAVMLGFLHLVVLMGMVFAATKARNRGLKEENVALKAALEEERAACKGVREENSALKEENAACKGVREENSALKEENAALKEDGVADKATIALNVQQKNAYCANRAQRSANKVQKTGAKRLGS